jgi:hypothetical protein
MLEVWVYSAHKLQLLYVSSMTSVCMSTPVDCGDNKRWFCCCRGYPTYSKNEYRRATMSMKFKPRKRIQHREGLEVLWRHTLNLMCKGNLLGPWRKCFAEILRSTRRTWILLQDRKANHVPIGIDCYDVCTRVNTGSYFLHAFATCTVIAVGRLKEYVHVRLDIYMFGWTCTLVVVRRLKEHVHVWLDIDTSGWICERSWRSLIWHLGWHMKNIWEPCKEWK